MDSGSEAVSDIQILIFLGSILVYYLIYWLILFIAERRFDKKQRSEMSSRHMNNTKLKRPQ